ncbi:UV-stimulated scaffold protein A-like [Babylonia areolata]|uniref:UV-stimulated scaffold protein A-like n=1 Tax=Babylonia areolata TaxID=304850 RepID=UPI003FD2185C
MMSEGQLDHELAKQLASLVEKLTTTGAITLDAQLMKDLKKICKKSDMYVERVYQLLMTQLNKEHAEIRLSTFQIIDEIFNRSHAFRELLVTDFQDFLELTVEMDQHHQPLPPPKAAANKLKTDALRAVQQWQDKYGSAYKKLALGYKFLKTCKHVNFDDIRARTLAEQRRIEQREEKKQKALAAKLEKARKEFSELKKEITDTATEAENCIELLLPKPDLLFTELDFGIGDRVGSSGATNHVHSEPQASASLSHHRPHASASTSDLPGCDRDMSKSTFRDGPSNSIDTPSTSSETSSASKTNSDKPLHGASQLNQDFEKRDPSQNTAPVHPGPNDDSQSDESDNDDDDSDDEDFEAVDGEEAEELGMVRTHGLGSRGYNLQLEIGASEVHLTETEDNRDLFGSLKDSSCLVSMRYLPQVVRWLEVLSKTGGSQTEIKAMIDLKQRLENIKAKCAELRVEPDPSAAGDQQSESDEEMEEVPEKEGYEPVIPAHLRAEYGLDPLPASSRPAASVSKSKAASASGGSNSCRKQDPAEPVAGPSGAGTQRTPSFWNLNERNKAASVQDPTSRAATLVKLGLKDEERPSTSKGKPATVTGESSSGGDVPTLPFGPDLVYWGTPDKIEAPSVLKNDSLHRFWKPVEVENEKPSQNEIAAVMNRTFHYTGEFVPVKWKCRAKLPNGKLCERMDRVKCPFHGKIIPRDEDGQPSSDPAGVQTETGPAVKEEPRDTEESKVPPWLDAELQAEIEAATGHDLGSQRSKAICDKGKGSKGKGKGKGKGKKEKHGGLTDIREYKNTTRARLEAKVFSKRAQKRVASALNAADYKRVRDKFGNQFNYSIKN